MGLVQEFINSTFNPLPNEQGKKLMNLDGFFPCRMKQHIVHICCPENGTVVINLLLFENLVHKAFYTPAEMDKLKTEKPDQYQFIMTLIQRGYASVVNNAFVKAGVGGELEVIYLDELLQDYAFTATGERITLDHLYKLAGITNHSESLAGKLDWVSVKYMGYISGKQKFVAKFIPKEAVAVFNMSYSMLPSGQRAVIPYGTNRIKKKDSKGDVIVCADLGNGSPNMQTVRVVHGSIFADMYDNNFGQRWGNLVAVNNKPPVIIASLPKLVKTVNNEEEFLTSLLRSDSINNDSVKNSEFNTDIKDFNYVYQVLDSKLKFPCSSVVIKRIHDTSKIKAHVSKSEVFSRLNWFTFGRHEDVDGNDFTNDLSMLNKYLTVFTISINDFDLYAFTMPTSTGKVKLVFTSRHDVLGDNSKIMFDYNSDSCLFLCYHPLFVIKKDGSPFYMNFSKTSYQGLDDSLTKMTGYYTTVEGFYSKYNNSLDAYKHWYGSVIYRSYIKSSISKVKDKDFGNKITVKIVSNIEKILSRLNSSTPVQYINSSGSKHKLIVTDIRREDTSSCPEHIKNALYVKDSYKAINYSAQNLSLDKELHSKFITTRCLSFKIEINENNTIFEPNVQVCDSSGEHCVNTRFYVSVSYLDVDSISKISNLHSRYLSDIDEITCVITLGCSSDAVRPYVYVCDSDIVKNWSFDSFYDAVVVSQCVSLLMTGEDCTTGIVTKAVSEHLMSHYKNTINNSDHSDLIKKFSSYTHHHSDMDGFVYLFSRLIQTMDGAYEITNMLKAHLAVTEFSNKILAVTGVVLGAYYTGACTLGNTKKSLNTVKTNYCKEVSNIIDINYISIDSDTPLAKAVKATMLIIDFTVSYLTYWANNVDDFSQAQGRSFLYELGKLKDSADIIDGLSLSPNQLILPLLVEAPFASYVKFSNTRYNDVALGQYIWVTCTEELYNSKINYINYDDSDNFAVNNGYTQLYRLMYKSELQGYDKVKFFNNEESNLKFIKEGNFSEISTGSSLYKSFRFLFTSMANNDDSIKVNAEMLSAFLKSYFISMFDKIRFTCVENEFQSNDKSKFRLKLLNIDNDAKLVLKFWLDLPNNVLHVKGQSNNNLLDKDFSLDTIGAFIKEGIWRDILSEYNNRINLVNEFILDVVFFCVKDLDLDLMQIFTSYYGEHLKDVFARQMYKYKLDRVSTNNYSLSIISTNPDAYCSVYADLQLIYPQTQAAFKALFYDVLANTSNADLNAKVAYKFNIKLNVQGVPFHNKSVNLLDNAKLKNNSASMTIYSFSELRRLLYDIGNSLNDSVNSYKFELDVNKYSQANQSRYEDAKAFENSLASKKRLKAEDFEDFDITFKHIMLSTTSTISKSVSRNTLTDSRRLCLRKKK